MFEEQSGSAVLAGHPGSFWRVALQKMTVVEVGSDAKQLALDRN